MASPVIATSAFSNTNASIATTCNVPASTANGDLLLAFVQTSGNSTPSALSGWTIIGTATTGSASTDSVITAYARIAASEPANYTFDRTVSSDAWVDMLRITGALGSLAALGAASVNAVTAATITYNPVVMQSNAGLLVASASHQGTATLTGVWTPPSGFTNSFNNGNTNVLTVDSLAVATAGTYGPYTGTFVGSGASDKMCSILVPIYSILPGSLVVGPPMFNNFLVR
jgi:hypothetical protein